MLVIDQLKEKNRFTKSELEVVHFIVAKPRCIIDMTIEELAQKTYSSNASIIRICKKVGMSGFTELKIKIASELNTFIITESRIDPDIPIQPNSTKEQIAKEILNLQYQALTDTYNSVNLQDIWEAAKLIDQSDLVIMVGRGESLLPLRSLKSDLARIGKRSSCEMITGFEPNYPYFDSIKTCAIVLSQYGKSKTIIAGFEELYQQKVPIIFIHGNPKSPLVKKANISICFNNNEEHNKFAACASRVTKHYILDLIYSFLYSMNYNQNVKMTMKHAEMVYERQKKVDQVIEEEIIHQIK